MYKITITPQALRAVEKLQLGHIQKNLIVKAIDSLANYPERGFPLRRELKGYWKLRIGDYRIVYEIVRKEVLVIVIGVGHRKNIYEILTRKARLM